MADGRPMWWMQRMPNPAENAEEAAAPQGMAQLTAPIQDLLRRIQGGDRETLLLLFLLVLLWQEDADQKLLLALAYILL